MRANKAQIFVSQTDNQAKQKRKHIFFLSSDEKVQKMMMNSLIIFIEVAIFCNNPTVRSLGFV